MKKIVLLSLLIFCSSCISTGRIVVFNKPSARDFKIFPNRLVCSEAEGKSPFIKSSSFELPDLDKWVSKFSPRKETELEEFLINSKTTSFIVVRNDSILYEKYFNGLTPDQHDIVFSVGKVVITSLLAIALDEGTIKNLDQKVAEFIPSFKDGGKERLSLRHMLQMNSGINHDEYKRIWKTAQTYYGRNLDRMVDNVKVDYEPGTKFRYKSMETQILGRCIEEASGMSIAAYLEEKLWKPMEMENNACFTLDRKGGTARMYGGLGICSNDILKLGKLFLQDGMYNGKRIISEEWIKQIQNRSLEKGEWYGYKNGWWRDTAVEENFLEPDDFFAAGYQGQYLFISPKTNTMVLRQGLGKGDVKWSISIHNLIYEINKEFAHKEELTIDQPEKFIGKYSLGENKYLEVEYDGDEKWATTFYEDDKRSKKLKMVSYCKRSIFHRTNFHRLLFEVKDGKVVSLYYDDESDTPKHYIKDKS